MDAFANNIRKRAAALNLSNAEVARRAGLSERRYGNYAIGRREPDLATLRRIAEVLGSSVDDLLRETGDDSSFDLRQSLTLRLVAAAATLPASDIEMVVIQVEAAASFRSRS